MSREDLQNGYYWASQQLFEHNAIYDRVMGIYDCWNKNNVRLHERFFPIIINWAAHHVAYSYPKASCPVRKEN
jgi:hypothetical protein